MTFVRHNKRGHATGRRWFLRAVALVIVALAAGEIIARVGIGLGDPPLFVADSRIEYLNKPGTYNRYHHLIHINQWCMRSPDFPEKKSDSSELRVLVVGDSVVYGGAWLADEQVATFQLAEKLEKASGRRVVVANISAGSWGPPNQLAYLERFGTFDADAMLVVWSSHDAWDVPTFAPLGKDHPTVRPVSALEEFASRYVFPRLMLPAESPAGMSVENADVSLRAARSILELARARRIPVAVILHATRRERNNPDVEGLELLRSVAKSEGVPIRETASVLSPEATNGRNLYRDDIHPDAEGQAAVADLYFRTVVELLSGPGPASGATPPP